VNITVKPTKLSHTSGKQLYSMAAVVVETSPHIRTYST